MVENTVRHNTVICNATMSACWIDGIWHLALDLNEMAENTLQRNTIVRNATMRAGWMDGVWKLALDLLSIWPRTRRSTTPSFATLR